MKVKNFIGEIFTLKTRNLPFNISDVLTLIYRLHIGNLTQFSSQNHTHQSICTISVRG